MDSCWGSGPQKKLCSQEHEQSVHDQSCCSASDPTRSDHDSTTRCVLHVIKRSLLGPFTLQVCIACDKKRYLLVSYETIHPPEVAHAPITEPITMCTDECCANSDVPNQPVDQALLDETKVQVGKKNEYWSLNPQWYKDFPWIHVCEIRKNVLCYHCVMMYKKGLLTLTSFCY